MVWRQNGTMMGCFCMKHRWHALDQGQNGISSILQLCFRHFMFRIGHTSSGWSVLFLEWWLVFSSVSIPIDISCLYDIQDFAVSLYFMFYLFLFRCSSLKCNSQSGNFPRQSIMILHVIGRWILRIARTTAASHTTTLRDITPRFSNYFAYSINFLHRQRSSKSLHRADISLIPQINPGILKKNRRNGRRRAHLPPYRLPLSQVHRDSWYDHLSTPVTSQQPSKKEEPPLQSPTHLSHNINPTNPPQLAATNSSA